MDRIKNRFHKDTIGNLQVQYKENISISKEQWKDLFFNEEIFYDRDRELLIRIFNRGGKATATELAQEVGAHPSSYITPVVNLSKRIKKHLNISIPKDRKGKEWWWHVPFWGTYKASGHFEWILRPELDEAIEELVFL